MNTNVIAETISPNSAEEKDELETPAIKDEPEEDEDDDAVVVPALEEAPSETEVKEANQKSISQNLEEKQEEVEEPVETESSETLAPTQPNPVEGETPRERALRIKIAELREENRKKDELIKITPPPMDTKEYDELREMYSDEELQKVEKLFDVIGKKKGYVKAEEIYTQSGNEVLEQFMEKHQEYKPENDPEDVRWTTFKNILIKDYNREGKNPKELVRIFEKVHKDVQEQFGEARTIAPKRNAEVQKVRSVSHTGGTRNEVARKSNAPTDPKIRAMFKDFDDDDF